MAPCYFNYPLAILLHRNNYSRVFVTDADIRNWLPGDNLFNSYFFIPPDMPGGEYQVEVAIIDKNTTPGQLPLPKVKLAIAGVAPDGWHPLGRVTVK